MASSSSSGTNALDFTAVKVFSATMAAERDQLGEKITNWLHANQGVEVVDKIVTQSSDEAFHCLAITLFFNPAVPK